MLNFSRLKGFDWNKWNVDKNWIKHRVSYVECEEVFTNQPLKIFPDKQHSQKEKRFAALGGTNKKILLTVIFTVRNNKIRVISARRQSRKEKKVYEQKEETT